MDVELVRRGVMVVISFFGGGMAALFGASSVGMVQVLVALMVMDYIGGVACAVGGVSPKSPDGRLCSATGFRGLVRKGGIVAVILVARLLDVALGRAMVLDVTIMFFIVNEGLSILENAALLGLPVPKVLKRTLTALNKDIDDDETDGKGGK